MLFGRTPNSSFFLLLFSNNSTANCKQEPFSHPRLLKQEQTSSTQPPGLYSLSTTNNQEAKDIPSSMADNQNYHTDTRPSAERHPTSEPFTDPNPDKEGVLQHAAKGIALPLAAAGGVVAEVSRKVKEFVTGHSTKIDTSHKDEP